MSKLDKAECVRVTSKKQLRIVAIPDVHFPFSDYKKLSSVYKFIASFNPTHVIQLGDLYDFYTFSSFSRSIDFITPGEELKQGRAEAEKMWQAITKVAPKAEKYQLLGNHERRIYTKLMKTAPEYESIADINSMYRFDGVRSFTSDRSELSINDLIFMHGYSTRPGYHMRYFLRPVIHGHTHRGGVVFEPVRDTTLFELDCGHLVDSSLLPFQYTETKTNKWISGFGIIDQDGPRFIAL